jgi:hypothetical protein
VRQKGGRQDGADNLSGAGAQTLPLPHVSVLICNLLTLTEQVVLCASSYM